MTDIAITSPVERVARVIAAQALSPNGDGIEGGDRPVSTQVDSVWQQEVDRALAVLRTLREPTPEMVEAGQSAGTDPASVWSAMVNAAIASHTERVTL